MSTRYDPEREAHKAWLGLLQPVGVVVSPPALMKAQAVLDKNVAPLQQALLAVVERPASVYRDADPVLTDLPRFAREVLGWAEEDLLGGAAVPERLAVALPEYGEILRPDYAVIDGMDGGKVLLLVYVVPHGADLDKLPHEAGPGWHASPQARLERLLRHAEVPAGLLCNGTTLRLVYAPRGESSGHMGFPVAEMCTVSGRPILAALHLLLGEHRVFGAPDGQRLLDLLKESRKYQTEVSTRLAEQVLSALGDLLRGVQAADEAARGRVLYDLPANDPQHIYGGLLTVIMRLVFLLYAEDRGLMPDSPIYARNYAIGGLFERLRADAGRYPDTMDQRFGAWAWLLTTFRMAYDGGGHGDLRLPTRHGQLFNPDEYPFLEGRPPGVHRVMGEPFEAPRVSDGVVWRVLQGLLVLDGERLSYRALDVEQIGSVYESMMGFDVRTLPGRAVAVRPKHVVVDLDALLALPGGKRAAWLKDHGECDLAGGAAEALKSAATVEDAVLALGRKLSPQTPRALAPGALFLQPGEERRRSGSHYTPRELTEPIVRTTLRPVLEALGERPTPEQILDLKVCDPAMGSGAFLVEACRQLAEALVAAWELHDCTPPVPPDEDPLLLARRLVAQRCLYGVDKNPFAVNLAKLSLWLVTLARDHAFTFLDHALKHGDSLVGLTREQIGAFHWSPPKRDWSGLPLLQGISASVHDATLWRRSIQDLGEGEYDRRRAAWREAEEALDDVRLIGDLCVAAFFDGEKDKEREALRVGYQRKLDAWKAGGDRSEIEAIVAELRGGAQPVPCFHWEIEFPEVFGRANAGFDAMVGNPPFAGKNTIANGNRTSFIDWLKQIHAESHGNADIVAHFYRIAFSLMRDRAAFGLIATNTIAQGDTRSTGLRWIGLHGGELYAATRRRKWPGFAAVVVSVVHVLRGVWQGIRELDGQGVTFISAFLLPGGAHGDPQILMSNGDKSFQGSIPLGMGFTFDDSTSDHSANSLADMNRIVAENPRNSERIQPFIGYAEVASSPSHAYHRYIINFGSEDEAAARAWPDLMGILEIKVRPSRMRLTGSATNLRRARFWWQYGSPAADLYRAAGGLRRVLVAGSQASAHFAFAFLRSGLVYSSNLSVITSESYAAFSSVQSRVHEVWTRVFMSTMKDDLAYTPTTCFETYPFLGAWQTDPTLEAAGQTYYDFRAALMIRNDEGLTKTYNRFHDPDERSPDILRLRELHAEMDRAVLDAYGWTDISTDCEFLLDYEIDEETWGNKKKPWRYRWPDEVRDEVLARLLDLNQKRYQEEVAAGLHDKKGKRPVVVEGEAPVKEKKPRALRGAGKKAEPAPTSPLLFGEEP